MSEDLALDVVAFCATLPRGDGPATAPLDDVAALRRALPGYETVWTLCEQLWQRLMPAESITRHGDLRLANILVTRGRLSGVLGWDGWHPAGVVGADLLNVLVFDPRRRLVDLVRARPWASSAFAAATRHYWRSLSIPASEVALESAGLAWWLGRIAADVSPDSSSDERWTRDNIDTAMAAFA